ncbi:MAG: dehydrogenase [Epulopiscium sp. Nele67-Bin004]|nr:MAG: dehydrogenase [Epulopiscium sp. Nele67-Bin004]
MRIVVIGAVAAGTSAAAKARRGNDKAEIVVYERGTFISYSSCGTPYYIGGDVDDIDELTPRDVRFFKKYNIDIKTGHEVIDIDREEHTVTIKNLETQQIILDKYDKLIIATGASPYIPPIVGVANENVFFLRTIADAQHIKSFIAVNSPKTAVIVGSGFVGMELIENLMQVGLDVTILESNDKICSNLDVDMAKYLRNILESKGVKVRTSIIIKEITGNKVLLEGGETVSADFVIMATGVRPNVELAKGIGLEIGQTGGIKVDRHMKTNDDNIYACGDCIETFCHLTGKPVYVAMGTVANKTGRIAGDNVTGGINFYPGGLGTSIFKVFDHTVASTGLSEADAKSLGYDIVISHNIKPNKSLYMGGEEMVIKAIADTKFGRLLGVQIIGKEGVDKRIDVFVTLITYEAKIETVADLDLAYAPPFSTAKDPVMYTGMILHNAMDNNRLLCTPDSIPDGAQIIDVRSESDYKTRGHVEGAINIPFATLRDNFDKIDKKGPTVVYCNKGVTGNAAQNLLINNGFKKVYNLSGGNKFYTATRK